MDDPLVTVVDVDFSLSLTARNIKNPNAVITISSRMTTKTLKKTFIVVVLPHDGGAARRYCLLIGEAVRKGLANEPHLLPTCLHGGNSIHFSIIVLIAHHVPSFCHSIK